MVHKTLLNTIRWCFHEDVSKQLYRKYPEKLIYRSSNARLKAPLQILFCKCSDKKEYSEISKFPDNVFAGVTSFLFRYRPANHNSSLQRKPTPIKEFLVSFDRKQSTIKTFYWSNRITIDSASFLKMSCHAYFREYLDKV